MTVADYLNDLALRFNASDVQLHVSGSKYGASELLAGLGNFDKGRPIAIETGTEGCFIRDTSFLSKLSKGADSHAATTLPTVPSPQ